VEIVHETGGLIGGGATQQVATDVARVDGEVHERVDEEDSGVLRVVIYSNVVASRVAAGGELGSGTVANASEVNARTLDEVTGLTVGNFVTDETQVPHTNRGNDGLLGMVDVGKTNRQHDTREVSRPIENRSDAAGGCASKIDQEQVVVQEGTRDEGVSSVSSREKLGNHQTDVDIDGEGTEVTAVGEASGGGIVGLDQVTRVIEVVDGSSEGERIDGVADGSEVILGVDVQERCGPNEVRDNETVGIVEVSSVRIEATKGNSSASSVLAGGPGREGSVAVRNASRANLRAGREHKSVQTTRSVTCVVTHLGNDPRGGSILVELIGTSTRKIVGRVESRDHVVVEVEKECIVLVTAVDIANGYVDEKAKQAASDHPVLVSRKTDVVRSITEKLATCTSHKRSGANDLANVRATTAPINGNQGIGKRIRCTGGPYVSV